MTSADRVAQIAANEHLIFNTMRKFPDGEVRVYSEAGKLIAGTWCYQATNDLDRMHAELAAAHRERDEARAELDSCRTAQAKAIVRYSQDEIAKRLWAAEEERDEAEAKLDRLHSWAGLMELLDEHWPADIFLTRPGDNRPANNDGPHIVSLIRHLDTARAERDAALAQLAKVRELAESWRYKGEFGFGAWQAGEGPDQEGQILDDAATELRAVLAAAGGNPGDTP